MEGTYKCHIGIKFVALLILLNPNVTFSHIFSETYIFIVIAITAHLTKRVGGSKY